MQTIYLWWSISILACQAGRCRNSQTKTCESESYISGNSVKAGWCNQTAALETTWHSKEVCYSYQIYRSYHKSGHLKKNSCSSHQATHNRTTLRIVCKKFHIVRTLKEKNRCRAVLKLWLVTSYRTKFQQEMRSGFQMSTCAQTMIKQMWTL